MIIFVALGKGLRSYGKVVYAFGTLPVLGFFVVCVKVLGYSSAIPTAGIGSVLDQTHWNEFFIDTRVISVINLQFYRNLHSFTVISARLKCFFT